MKRILFVGDHPLGKSGNSNMMRAILSRVDMKKYRPSCFANFRSQPEIVPAMMNPIPITIVQGFDEGNGMDAKRLLATIGAIRPDAVIFVGLDIWAYAPAMEGLGKARDSLGFKCAAIFPYDLQEVRSDWVSWIKFFDVARVYSRYGHHLLKKDVPGVKYFRPPLYNSAEFKPFSDNKRTQLKERLFPTAKDKFVFGFVGVNQIRKDPLTAMQAFAMVHEKHPDTAIYFQTNMEHGPYNLLQIANDLSIGPGALFHQNHEFGWIDSGSMNEVYNSIDCLVNTSLQEGLSWTLLEAMLAGTPVVASETTAQIELVRGAGALVRCETPTDIPVFTARGVSRIPAKKCLAQDVADAMSRMLTDKSYRAKCHRGGKLVARRWLKGESNINSLIGETLTPKLVAAPVSLPRDGVLFAQHSAAGDVLMTTRCLKAIRDRHADEKIVYMTSPQYMDIVEGNPYIDKVIPWDDKLLNRYRVVYNPHGEKILPGHWGRNCNSILSDFYWKILNVEPCDFFVKMEKPQGFHIDLDKICVVHTTGGDPQFRTYKYMGDVCEALRGRFTTIQLGGEKDFPAGADLDLRGKLSYAETAWVMSKAKVAVTVDSYISHLAGALGVNQVCLFGSGNAFVVRPNQLFRRLICLVPDYIHDCPGLGPCSASVRDCPAPCTGRHDPKRIIQAIDDLLDSITIDLNPVEFWYEDESGVRRASFT